MAYEKQLPSGSWRCLVYDYTDEAGKRHYKSFTSDNPEPEGKLKAQHLTAEFAYTKKRNRQEKTDMSLQESMEQYCTLKSNVLSPSTLREYKRMIKNYYAPLISMRTSKITTIQVQRWVNNFSATHSPKTTRNAFGLLTSTMTLFKRSDILTDITMPQTMIPNLYTPSDTDVKSLLEHVKGTYLETAICLAAFGPMRRGEICALTKGDINGCNVTVSKSISILRLCNTICNTIIKKPSIH